jgi:hypothetical protein
MYVAGAHQSRAFHGVWGAQVLDYLPVATWTDKDHTEGRLVHAAMVEEFGGRSLLEIVNKGPLTVRVCVRVRVLGHTRRLQCRNRMQS